MKWTNTSDKLPSLPGYYYTYYFNIREGKHFYKAIWWNGTKWISWKPGPDKYIETVERFIEDSKNDYYCPCVEWVNEKWKLMNEQTDSSY
jgi:hypothetical protein